MIYGMCYPKWHALYQDLTNNQTYYEASNEIDKLKTN